MSYGTKVGGFYIVCALLRIFIFFGFCKVGIKGINVLDLCMFNIVHEFFFCFFIFIFRSIGVFGV